MTKNLKHFLILSLIGISVFGQVVNETNPPDYIKSITIKGNTPESQLPIIRLGEDIVLEFDALNGNEDDFYYKIQHFNYDWTPSRLSKVEYLQGFDNQRIVNYENSFNSYQIYSHYKLGIPNNQTRRLLKSGNYMISIYDDYDEMVFSRKFMVYQEQANVGVAIKRSRDVRHINQKQSVDIRISPRNFNFNNPKQTVKALIIQNNNLNTAISGLKPMYTVGNELIYRYDVESSFWGGNEYLFLDTKDPRVANAATRYIDLKDLYHNYLYADLVRANRAYTYNPDINGNFVITAIDADDPSIEADYIWVHFYLDHPEFLDGKNIHVYGNFNNYLVEEATKMTYSEESGFFEGKMLLKQGFYNYKYVEVDSEGNLDEGAISGNFDQTENNYKVLVYYRDLGGRYDEIIGVGEGSSINISN
ncbi:MAG: DUF5103 domain-containing protein [Flavobacteriaceae bacterium]|nr:DUF5103 domain-containing protein [Bacteroidia bacterium]NNL60399.1 DUF5103 domain-containing protein [Flavobacteriaceae bacterium]